MSTVSDPPPPTVSKPRRLLQIAVDLVRHPVQWLALATFLGAMALFMAFWRARGILQWLLFPLALPALVIVLAGMFGGRRRRRANQ